MVAPGGGGIGGQFVGNLAGRPAWALEWAKTAGGVRRADRRTKRGVLEKKPIDRKRLNL